MQNTISKPKKILRPRRTLNRLALAFVAICVAGLGQYSFQKQVISDGIILYLIAIFLFSKAIGVIENRQRYWITPYRGLFNHLGIAEQKWQHIAGGVCLILALGISYFGMIKFEVVESYWLGWNMYVWSLLLLIAGTLILTKPSSYSIVRRDSSMSRLRWFALFAIILLALFLRLWQFDSIPFGVWYDEAEAGLQARRWLNEPNFKTPFYEPINISGQFIMLYAMGLQWVSDSVYGLRINSVMFGVLGVIAAFLFGKELRGTSFGLTMAFFMAIMRWSIDFSRIAMTGIDAPFFILISLFYLLRLTKRGNLRDAVFAGIALGMGLNFYTAFRLFGVALAIFVIIAALIWHQWLKRATDKQFWLRLIVRGMAIVLAVWLVFMPLGKYAIKNPESFGRRMQMTSIITKRDDPNLISAISTTFKKHVQMFHIRGDNNGRHNLPGEPMLDPIMGMLFILGIGLALRNLFSKYAKPTHLFFFILMPISLLGGVLSLDFEAPQGLRSIAILPAIAYFCALPVAGLAIESRHALRPLSTKWLVIFASLMGLYMAGLNANVYFFKQANDFSVWNSYSTPETITARQMSKFGPDYQYHLSPFLVNHPSIRFIAPNIPYQKPLPLPDALPIRSLNPRPTILFIHPDDRWVFDEAQRIYPAGQFEVFTNDNSPPSVFMAVLRENDLISIRGIELRYWAGSEIRHDQIPIKAMRVENINVDWENTIPLTPPFIAEWTGILYAEQYGLYQIHVTAPDETILEINGTTVISGTDSQDVTWELAKGNHAIRLQAKSGTGHVNLSWTPPFAQKELIPEGAFYSHPITNNGLMGRYYMDTNWQGIATMVRIDPFLDTYFHFTPLPRPYSVEWTGLLETPTSGIYGLGLQSVGVSELYIGDNLIVRSDVPNSYIENSISLKAGMHNIRVRFQDTMDRSQIHLYWRSPTMGSIVPIPSQHLYPPLGSAWQGDKPFEAPSSDFEAKPMNLSHAMSLQDGLSQPRDITVGADGRVYVADVGVKQILVYQNGQLQDSWSETSDGAFVEPLALVTSSDGNIIVLDASQQWIYRLTPDGKLISKIGGPDARLYNPRGMTIFSQDGIPDALIIADTGTGRLALYDVNGISLGSIGMFGDGPGQFNEPVDVLRDEFGTYFVVEGSNIRRWQRIDSYGKPLAVWPIADTPVAFDGSHMAWAADGSILMTNSHKHAIRRFTPDGELLDEWQAIASIQFKKPVGIFVDKEHNQLYVSDVETGKVHVFNVE